MNCNKGDKIKFAEEKQKYTIRSLSGRYLICTKPFNLKKTTIYSIVDLEENIRSSDDQVLCLGYETDEQCDINLQRLIDGKMKLSERRKIELNIDYVG